MSIVRPPSLVELKLHIQHCSFFWGSCDYVNVRFCMWVNYQFVLNWALFINIFQDDIDSNSWTQILTSAILTLTCSRGDVYHGDNCVIPWCNRNYSVCWLFFLWHCLTEVFQSLPQSVSLVFPVLMILTFRVTAAFEMWDCIAQILCANLIQFKLSISDC